MQKSGIIIYKKRPSFDGLLYLLAIFLRNAVALAYVVRIGRERALNYVGRSSSEVPSVRNSELSTGPNAYADGIYGVCS